MSLALGIEGSIARLRIDRAQKRNAFNQAMWEALPRLVGQAMADPKVRLLVLESATPGIFCAGADISELLDKSPDASWRAANHAAINRAQYELTRASKPTLAFIDGDCVGGGCGLALACDLRVSTPRARFGITPAKLGLVYPLHDTKLLVDLVGPSQAKRLLFTGTLIDADEALRIGLIDRIADTPDAEVEAIAAASPHSQRETKAMIRRILDGQTDGDEATRAAFADAFTLPDFQEGVRAFTEKRRPSFGN
ncbi:enoyl-CoA hydratase/isomerase family protein [Sphingomonas sp.]|uniref:enoyl-CoA hydratase/isomerase family protein n=1 Tax=Sphingomonas sp. TaxID=28214 RepID=UPI002DEA9E80|nr:enoyl-CoA hydratase-related protein [Sphingomonas sp.]HEV2567429.1 enoyl-CoA hydratase-related protein [Sphingomonas sp.]